MKVLREETADDQCETTADINALKNKVQGNDDFDDEYDLIYDNYDDHCHDHCKTTGDINALKNKVVVMILMVMRMILRMI